MDILFRLRVVFWGFVIILWGIFMYQYISRDLKPIPEIHLSSHPFQNSQTSGTPHKQFPLPFPQKEVLFKPVSSKIEVVSQKPLHQEAKITSQSLNLIKQSPSVPIKEIPYSENFIPEEHTQNERIAIYESFQKKIKTPVAPENFSTRETKHFVIYHESTELSEEVVSALEALHGEIMLDLIAFSPWTRDQKVFVYFCKNQDTYQKLTGRAAWSGGTASSSERKIYLYESEESFGILAHELTHIYFDSFFSPLTPSPLWLSEGMATFIQSERGLSTPTWLTKNLEILKRGGGFKLKDLIRIENLQGADDDSVRLWYAQCYSLVRFLMKLKSGDAFYQFCKNLKEGQPVSRAMFRAYGMPYNKLSALEYAWKYDLKTGKISNLSP